ncbi:MAG: signal peptidase II [Candidatus Nanoarchaeia archaeon]
MNSSNQASVKSQNRKNSKLHFSLHNFKQVGIFSIILIIIDQIVKIEFCHTNFLFSNCILNTGSAYGMFSQVEYYTQLVAVLGIMMSIGIIYFYTYIIEEFGVIATSLFLAGIVSNTIDRILFMGVQDMLSIMGVELFGIFNVADVYLVIASTIAIYYVIISYAK